jgi:hypothetical protein
MLKAVSTEERKAICRPRKKLLIIDRPGSKDEVPMSMQRQGGDP